MDGSHALCEMLIGKGSDRIFGYPGGSVIPLFDAIYDYSDQLRCVLMRHEQAVAHAADGYARAKGKTGIGLSTSGPGATNMVTGIANAFLDSSPTIYMGGQVVSSLLRKNAFQETDMMGITASITKASFQPLSANDILIDLEKAYRISVSGRQGPIYIDLPKDCLIGEVTDDVTYLSLPPVKKPGIKGDMVKAVDMILKAERPIIMVGGGVILSRASAEVKALCEMLNSPVISTLMGKGGFPEEHPLSLGMVGMHGTAAANYALTNSDLLIAIGCRFSDRVTSDVNSFSSSFKIIHIDIDSKEIGKNVKADAAVIGDAREILAHLLGRLKHLMRTRSSELKNSMWGKRIAEVREICNCNFDVDSEPIDPIKVMAEINKVMKAQDIIATGVGQHQMYAAHYLKRSRPRTFISSGGLGTMGFGLPAALGAKIAKPESKVLMIEGDGGFAMLSEELATSKVEHIPIAPVIMNNSYLGMVRQWLEYFMNGRYSKVHLGSNPDFVKLADAYGLEGLTVTRPSEIGEALQRSINSDETFLLDIHIDPGANILPMVPPQSSMNKMLGSCRGVKELFR